MFPSEVEIKKACQVLTKEEYKITPGLFNMCPLRAVLRYRGHTDKSMVESFGVAQHQVVDFVSAFDKNNYGLEVNTNSPEYKLGKKFREEYDKGAL